MGDMTARLETLRSEIHARVAEYYHLSQATKPVIPGRTYLQYAGAVYDERELNAMVDAILNGWWGLGRAGRTFCQRLASFIGGEHVVLTNSGSSSNLLAVSALLSPQFPDRIPAGAEVITPACTFPTTLNPLLQNGLRPVLVDVELGTYNVDVDRLEAAISPETRLIMFPHALGNPAPMDRIMALAQAYGLHVIEDNCDALGAEFDGRRTGSFGILSTCSFYPAHHITMGEGGAVCINRSGLNLYRIVRSLGSWGRACWCESDETNPNGACGNRFSFNIDGIEYDHKYVFSHIGYNLKPTEIQAAMALAQIDKLPDFIALRRRNFQLLHEHLQRYEHLFILPRWDPRAQPSWFGYPLTIRDDVRFTRGQLISHLEERGIQTRLFFAGNITRQPAYRQMYFRIAGPLTGADKVMKDTFFIGVYPGLTPETIAYILDQFDAFLGPYA